MVRKLESYLAEKARIALDDSDLTSRSDLRRDRLKSEGHIMALAARLCATSDKRLAKLELDPFVLELIDAAKRIESPPARDRAQRRIRKELRDVDTAALEARLDDLDSPSPNAPKRVEVVWANRLLEGGEAQIDAFIGEFPHADRGQIRTLVRNALRSKPAEKARAVKKLGTVLRDALTGAPEAAGETVAAGETDEEDATPEAEDGSDAGSEA